VATAPLPWINQRLLRGPLIFTSTVMYFITNLMKRIIRDSPFCSVQDRPGSPRAFHLKPDCCFI